MEISGNSSSGIQTLIISRDNSPEETPSHSNPSSSSQEVQSNAAQVESRDATQRAQEPGKGYQIDEYA